MKTYMENMSDMLTKCNRYSFEYGDAKAWDNRKKKMFNRHVPRGSVYMRLINQENKQMLNSLKESMIDLCKLTGNEDLIEKMN